MEDFLIILAQLMRYRPSSDQETAVFNIMQHNRHLCPAVERQLEAVLDNFVKYYAVSYDVQGPLDQGTDVLVRYDPNAEGTRAPRFVAIQVKSGDDLENPYWLKNLRSQYVQAKAEYSEGLEHYIIMACTSLEENRNKVRNMKKAFARFADVTVIDPAYALTFIHLNPRRIAVVVDSFLRQGDVVLQRARKSVEGLTPGQAAVVLAAIWQFWTAQESQFTLREVLDWSFVRTAYERYPHRDPYSGRFLSGTREQRLREDLELLHASLVTIQSRTDAVAIHASGVEALASIMLDAKVRFGYEGTDLLQYVFDLLIADQGTRAIFGAEVQRLPELDTVG